MQYEEKFTSERLVARIEAHGWKLVKGKGCHQHFSHPTIEGLITIPHPAKGFLPEAVVRQILEQAGG